ncbi:flagellar biosynthesis anti-sigma factor FlgM [Chitinimonas koreensis]|uniref:flagellar biosynthesis anti-sigma factor FlgM n=1 Tax=Chitinimonas koreensis TaxID=356302 RepID=UPI000427B80D|nr:flagellar biosynthesis anti-sigma factor FlgM [Chitinimonas koreensis]QNM95612.1 flagellar biosynthesis anti-sigma factor FlgM [Chitinimonas koreensis]
MKIDNSGKPLNTSLSRTDTRGGKTGQAETASAPEVRGDSVEIKPFSAKLASLEANLASQPVIDEAKVAEIRQAIAEGRFTVRADAIADKLMASVKELLSGKS